MRQENYINISNKELEKYIYRTLPFSRLVEIFESKLNTLSAPSLWDDPFENFILQATLNQNGESIQFAHHDHFFGQSWSMKYESDAMWRIYSPDKSCVRIRTTIAKLAKSLSDVSDSQAFIGKVEYYKQKRIVTEAKKLVADILNITTDVNLVRTLLFKRDSFEHEMEVRLIYFANHVEKRKDIYQYLVDPHYLIESVALDPRAPTQLVDVYRHYLRNKIGFKGDIIKSTLYDLPPDLIFKL